MKRKKRTVMNALYATAVVVCTIAATCMTVVAYTPLEKDYSLSEPNYDITDTTLIPEGVSDPDLIPDDFSLSETLLITENGETIPIVSPSNSPYVTCSHTFTDGIKKVHTKNSSEGCTVTVYKVKYCTKCNYIKSQTYLSKSTYVTCPH